MAESKEKPKVDVSGILSKEGSDAEKAASKKPSAKDKSAKSKKKHKHTHIEHHYDEEGNSTGYTMRHTPSDGGPETAYVAKDLDEVHDGLEQHLGEPNGDEGQEAEAQQMSSAQPTPQGA